LEDDVPKHALIEADGFRSKIVPYRRNRLVIWKADRLFRSVWEPKHWRVGYRLRRVDLYLLFGSPAMADAEDA